MPSTRCRTSSLTTRVLLITCDTVEIDTPARSATCFIVAIAHPPEARLLPNSFSFYNAQMCQVCALMRSGSASSRTDGRGQRMRPVQVQEHAGQAGPLDAQ